MKQKPPRPGSEPPWPAPAPGCRWVCDGKQLLRQLNRYGFRREELAAAVALYPIEAFPTAGGRRFPQTGAGTQHSPPALPHFVQC